MVMMLRKRQTTEAVWSCSLVLLAVLVASAAGDAGSEPEDPQSSYYEYVCSHYQDGCLEFSFDEELGQFVTHRGENEGSAKTLLLIEDRFRIFSKNSDGSAMLLPVSRKLINELIGSPPKPFDFAALADKMPGLSLVGRREPIPGPEEQDLVATEELDSLSPLSSVGPLQTQNSTPMLQRRTSNFHSDSRALYDNTIPLDSNDAGTSAFKRKLDSERSPIEDPQSRKPNPARLESYVKSYRKDKIKKVAPLIIPETPVIPVKLYGNLVLGGMFEYNKETCVAVCESVGQFLPHLTDCAAYYHCTVDGPVMKRCGTGTAWAPLINTCDYADRAVNDFCNMHDSCPKLR